MAEHFVDPKTILFREGDAGDFAYHILSGRVEILKHAEAGEVQLAVLEPGNVFGEMALFEPGAVRSATARTITATKLETLSAAELKTLFAQCPPRLEPFIVSLIHRLKYLNQRIAKQERATVLLDAAINKLTLTPECDALRGVMNAVVVHAANLPFTIGGHPETESAQGMCNLELPSTGSPPFISYQHCQIERTADGVFIVDSGSRHCTVLNGVAIGRAKLSFKAPLLPGENTLTLGVNSPYKIKILCE